MVYSRRPVGQASALIIRWAISKASCAHGSGCAVPLILSLERGHGLLLFEWLLIYDRHRLLPVIELHLGLLAPWQVNAVCTFPTADNRQAISVAID